MVDDGLVIVFGTQTGNAKDVAERIGREARRCGKKPQLMAMDAFALASHSQHKAEIVFVASTTGQGEVPSNMKRFWRSIMQRSLPSDHLQLWTYAIFGLGYVDYNVVAKKLDRRLASLGASQMIPRGLGDDQHPLGYEATLDAWLNSLWTYLRLAPGSSAVQLDAPQYTVTVLPPEPERNGHSRHDTKLRAVRAAYALNRLEASAAGIEGQHTALTEPLSGTRAEYGPANPCMATVKTNLRITAADHFQDTRHIEFHLGADGPKYDPGDILSIFPSQSEASIQRLLQMLGIDGACLVSIQLSRPEQPDEHENDCFQVRVEDLVRGALDIDSASPRRYFFEVLQHFATEPLQKERLEHFASAEGREDLALYNQNEGRTVLEVLQDFNSAAVPLEWLLQICPRLQPRQFSIASSHRAHPSEAHITLAVVDYRTPFKRRKRGLCSTWLATAPKEEVVPVWIEKGVLSLPQDPSKPVIMVGPGTGIAPFRAFLEERQCMLRAGQTCGASFLYFGCRSKSKDYYYKEEFEAMLHEGILASENGLQVAFSRDQSGKVYVQQLIRRNSRQLYSIICQGAYIYISGSAQKMPQEVASAFAEGVLQDAAGLTSSEAQNVLRILSGRQRYVVEAWN